MDKFEHATNNECKTPKHILIFVQAEQLLGLHIVAGNVADGAVLVLHLPPVLLRVVDHLVLSVLLQRQIAALDRLERVQGHHDLDAWRRVLRTHTHRRRNNQNVLEGVW